MQLAKPRYSQKGFPAYRYVPTLTPHPEIHPEGHSYKKPEEKVSYLPPDKWNQNDLYLYGVDLFNHGYWWEAHEAWEKVWMTTKRLDLEGQFLQGLIQFSAALLKLYSGSKTGFQNLYREAQKRIHFVITELSKKGRSHFMGLNLPEWMERMETFKNSFQETEEESIDPLHYASFPAILLNHKAAAANGGAESKTNPS
jgi:hypothetical protein